MQTPISKNEILKYKCLECGKITNHKPMFCGDCYSIKFEGFLVKPGRNRDKDKLDLLGRSIGQDLKKCPGRWKSLVTPIPIRKRKTNRHTVSIYEC